jgi:hypothetical protein
LRPILAKYGHDIRRVNIESISLIITFDHGFVSG